jgi:serine/threonine-protein kinase
MNEASQRGSWDALAVHLAEGVVLAGRFRLERAIGAGGMAEVWRAFDLHSERPVALKLLKAEVRSSAEAVQRLRREGEVLSALSHPAIVRVETYGQLESGVVFVAMELLEGETLGARMRRGPMQPAELAPIFAGTCAGLAAAHEKGIIHRDLKPDNIFLASSARLSSVKLLDFGISKVFGEARLTYTGEILGTPRYMSPEQLRAESDIDARVDIYALGVIAYEALVGRPPFLSSTPTELIVAILHGKIAPLSAVRPDLGPAIDAVVTRAMARVPQARYASATEFFAAFVNAAGLAQANVGFDIGRVRAPDALRTRAFGGIGDEPSASSSALAKPMNEARSDERTGVKSDDDLRPGTFSALALNDSSHDLKGPSKTLHVESVGEHAAEAARGHAHARRTESGPGNRGEPSGRSSRELVMPAAHVARTIIDRELPSFDPQRTSGFSSDSNASSSGTSARASWEHGEWADPNSSESPRSSRLARTLLAIAGLTAGAISAGVVMLSLELWERGEGAPIVNAPASTVLVAEDASVEPPLDASTNAASSPVPASSTTVDEPAARVEPREETSGSRPPEPQVRERRRVAQERVTDAEQHTSEREPSGTGVTEEQARPVHPIEAASRALAGGDPDACITILDDFIAHGGTPFALKRRADCSMRAGRREDAIRDYQRFCELVPDHPAVGTVREQLNGMGMSCP